MLVTANNKKIHYSELIILLALMTSLGALSIDLQLPAMPLILQSFGLTQANEQQWIITAYMLGFASAQIFYGPLSDTYGRKPILIFGLVIYVIASLACIFAESYWVFLMARATQGIGAAAARIMINAITRDFFKGNEMAKVTSLVMLIFIMVPVFAPSLGGLILWLSEWHTILYVFVGFGMLTLIWSLIRLPESLKPEDKKDLNLKQLVTTFKKVISEPMSMTFAIISGVIFSGFMAYLNSAEQIFSQLYNEKEAFPIIFGMIAIFFGIAAFVNSKIVMKYGAMKVTYYAMHMMIISNLIALIFTIYFKGLPPLWLFATNLGVINICIGLVYGNVMAIAMLPLGRMAGMGASVIGMISAFLAAGIGILISQQLTDSIFPITIGFLSTSILAFLLMFKYRNRELTEPEH
jgi:DHA1 family bicyclomycin/chloramphenicol resistance-like MFS transporter